MMQVISFEGIRLPWPLDWTAWFGRAAPLIMEIGFGGGHFLLALRKDHPEANIVGVENSHHCLAEVERRIALIGSTNLRLIHAEALMTLAYVCAPASLDRLYINFPDPFPKSAHSGRRLLNAPSLALIASRLKPGALLTIATDVDAYAESIAHDLALTPGLVNRHTSPWVTALAGRTVTRYERKAQARGATCHYFEWERDSSVSVPPAIPIQPGMPGEPEPMPNVVLHSPLSLEAIADAFRPIEYREGDIHVRLLSIYQNRSQNGLLIDSFIDEPLIEQRPGIAIASPDAPNRYVVRLSLIGYPRPTQGAHIAVRKVADWLKSLHPDTEVVQRHLSEPISVQESGE